MKKYAIILTSVFAIGASTVWAEENSNLKKPSFVGDVSGIEENDTFGYGPDALEDVYVFSHPCGTSPCDEINSGFPRVNGAGGVPEHVGAITGNPEKNTIGYTDGTLKLAAREYCYFAGCGQDGVVIIQLAR